MSTEDLARCFNVNVIGPQRLISAFLPLLEAGSQKKIINMFVATAVYTFAETD